jgi:hypothetical protein
VNPSLFAPSLAASPAVFGSDSFNRANGAVGNMDGYLGGGPRAWTVNSGTWAVASNVLSATVGGNLVVDLGVTVCRVQLQHTGAPSASAHSILGKFVDANNHWRVTLSSTALAIFEDTASVVTSRNTVAVSPVAGDIWEAWFLPGLIVAEHPRSGTRISYASASHAAGTSYGVRTVQNGMTFDNFIATAAVR